MCEPGQPLCLVIELDVKQLQRAAHQRPANYCKFRNLFFDVAHNTIVGCRGGAQHRNGWRQLTKDANNPAVIRAKIMAPIGNAVSLIDNEQAKTALY